MNEKNHCSHSFCSARSLALLIVYVNTAEEELTEVVHASELETEERVTEEMREEYRWNNFENPKS